ncbi:metallo-beta-lactamase superfamily protein [Pyrenophora tritici-repentis]|nr:metallo-beta-lactamase superfamily protein [Pyrenophora tritici-repentis]KAI1533966.1 metallo-beta-lactamase superfamily protein [Pyrenophora tritici-repentis]PZC89112.1 metallo-beta-lactamase superfamily protein [Pyrenophora tritici-repentis]
MATTQPSGIVSKPSTTPYAHLTQTPHKNQALNPIATQEPRIHSIYEPKTGTWQYIVADPSTKRAIIIDSVLDYDPTTQKISTTTADALLSLISKNAYHIDKILETHAHADHLTAASYLQHRLSQQQQGSKPRIGIGKRIKQVQELFAQKYGIPPEEYEGVFDQLFDDDETFQVGELDVRVIHLPGHTPDHVGYQIGANIFSGDSLLHPSLGTARCDFPGGSAPSLYLSARKLLSLPSHVKIWTGHDYPAASREAVPWMTVQDHKERNRHVKQGVEEEEFIRLRQERDAGLEAPGLLDPALQVN